MSDSNRAGVVIYSWDGKLMWIACSHGLHAMPPCAYCRSESKRSCDAPGRGAWGRCGLRMCEAHTTRVGEHHDLCREHAEGDRLATIKAGDLAQKIWWEVVETKALPIPGTYRPRKPIPGVVDPDDEPRA